MDSTTRSLQIGVGREEWVRHTAKWKVITKLHAYATEYEYTNDRYTM